MIVFPAIDIYGGKAVRLKGGKFDDVTVYGDPLDMAKRFEDAGARWLHVVDLNGAEGSGNNFGVIEKIASQTSLHVQSGGGLRDKKRVSELLSAGATRAVLGTVCANEPEFAAELINELGAEAIVCGLDVKNGKVAIKGWKETSAVTPFELGAKLCAYGAKYFLFTDVSRDGMLEGVNVDATAELQEKLGANVIASGGVKDIEDIIALKKRGLYGAIVGKAYYENKIDIREAIKYVGA